MNLILCPGCGLLLPNLSVDAHENFNASGECYRLYGKLSAYTLNKGDAEFLHQLAVDSYAAQHTGHQTKTITTSFALMGLYFALEHGYTGREVQRAHMKLAEKKKDWPRLEVPEFRWSLTVNDVLKANSELQRDEMLRKWADNIWLGWERHHTWVKQTAHELLGIKS